jgi:hypothetical protein
MKALKLILFALLFIVSAKDFSQTKELVHIRIQEKYSGPGFESYMRITYPDQPSRLIELGKLGAGGSGAEENGKIIQKEISTLLNQGYEITATSGGTNDAISVTILFLTRKKEK